MVVVETRSQPWLRILAAALALAAGVVHLGQVRVHLEEGWPVAAFFAIVGLVQVAAAALLLRPRPRGWFWFGITGSALVIVVWAVSRTVGLPFVAGGQPERSASPTVSPAWRKHGRSSSSACIWEGRCSSGESRCSASVQP